MPPTLYLNQYIQRRRFRNEPKAEERRRGVDLKGQRAGKRMPSDSCKHQDRVTGELNLDFSRHWEDHAVYSTSISAAVCRTCGYIELHANSADALCHWLAAKGDNRP
jgi:hypothetical protein